MIEHNCEHTVSSNLFNNNSQFLVLSLKMHGEILHSSGISLCFLFRAAVYHISASLPDLLCDLNEYNAFISF